MSWTADQIPDQTGRVAVVTGANGGLGLESTRALAKKGATVVMGVRNQEKADAAYKELLAENPDAKLKMHSLDLASLESVRAFAAIVLEDHSVVDLLINNAGVMATPLQFTADGFELQFGTNHLGHFALTSLLMPAIAKAESGRVVSVTSTARHFDAKLEPDNMTTERDYTPWGAYSRSKKANSNLGYELDRRLQAAGSPVHSLVAHPGLSNTDLQVQSVIAEGGVSQRFFEKMAKWVGMKASDGALPQLRAATDPTAKGGELYAPRYVKNGRPVSRPVTGWANKPAAGTLLWDLSEKETGVEFDVTAVGA